MIRGKCLNLTLYSFWPTFSAVIQAQETYAFDPEMTMEQSLFGLV